MQGTLPQALASLGKLRQFVVNGNDLSGTIPAFVGSYPGMGEAWLPRNNLSGPLDPSLCQSSGSGDNIRLQASSLLTGSPFSSWTCPLLAPFTPPPLRVPPVEATSCTCFLQGGGCA